MKQLERHNRWTQKSYCINKTKLCMVNMVQSRPKVIVVDTQNYEFLTIFTHSISANDTISCVCLKCPKVTKSNFKVIKG